MSKKKPLTDFQIGQRIKLGKNFWVGSNRERKAALSASKFFGVEVSTRTSAAGGYTIFFLNPSTE